MNISFLNRLGRFVFNSLTSSRHLFNCFCLLKCLLLSGVALLAERGFARENLETNSATFVDPPKWLSESKAQSAIDRIEQKLEWSTRKIQVHFYSEQRKLEAGFGFSAPTILAFTRRSDQSVHLGPKVTAENFKVVFGHELGHVIISQKYKNSIPGWIEEGLVNKIAGYTKINYAFLKKFTPRTPINQLTHPFDAKTMDEVNFKYQAALAAILMLEKKCPDFRELINLSLKQNLETFIPTYCNMPDLNKSFWKWIDTNGGKKY